MEWGNISWRRDTVSTDLAGYIQFSLTPTSNNADLNLFEITMNVSQVPDNKQSRILLHSVSLINDSGSTSIDGMDLLLNVIDKETTAEQELTYKLIDGDLTNDESLTESNVKFDDVIYYNKETNGGNSYYIILDSNNRVTIDYNHEIFNIEGEIWTGERGTI